MYLLQMIPIARTPLDSDSARGMADYTKSVRKQLENLTPWKKVDERAERLKKGIKSGTVVVIADANDNISDPLFSGAEIKR